MSHHLLADLVTSAPPKNRDVEAAKKRELFEKRMTRKVAARTAWGPVARVRSANEESPRDPGAFSGGTGGI